MTEAELQKALCRVLDKHGWRWHHETDSRRSAPGFPDIVAIGPDGRLLVAELKTAKGNMSQAQQEWINRWLAFQRWHTKADISGYGSRVLVVRPDMLRSVTRWIAGPQ